MALELAGIDNIGEFYSGHYISAVLEGDLKSTFERWKAKKEASGTRTPDEALAALAGKYTKCSGAADESGDAVERLKLAQDIHAYLLEALGYQRAPGYVSLGRDEALPVHLAMDRDGSPFLWVVDAPFPEASDDDPLTQCLLSQQLPSEPPDLKLPVSEEDKSATATWREIMDDRVFMLDHPPRWVLFLCGSEAVLIERHKWSQGKYLRFDLGVLFGRKQAKAMRAVAGLLHREVLAPDSGLCLHDTLDENSHKHAFAVSSDLKHGVRRAVELLANEAVWFRREKQKKGVFNEDEIAGALTSDCLTWLYRLLFLFYVEARGGELSAVPMNSDAYRKGYSLETLRDLELVPLNTEQSRNGTFIHDSLQILFQLLNQGFPHASGQHELSFHGQLADDIQIQAMNSPLFDDSRLKILKGVKFRNHVLQEVLQLLSLSAQKKSKFRGRISYAQLGINQLGSVYEGLLSYTGFFANEDLYEVASAKDNKTLSGKPAAERESLKTYFVPESKIEEYKDEEIVKDENERKVVHKKGSFIFRLAGRNREKSASYYTPEVLTQCLVKYALKELLWDEGEEGEKPVRKKTADEILALTICEPAMGSSAFLIEAVDQLADAYLEARQEEVKASGGEIIPPEDYQREKRRVKARLATNNCYGVDLNPTAVELAKTSLWLATMYEGGKCPWFGLRLATGNSLVGARREVFKTVDVTRPNKKDDPNWLGLVPEPVPLHHGESIPPRDEVDWANWTAPLRPKGTIYHFLLPAEGMAAFDKDKVIKGLAPESVKRIKAWRKEFCKPFNKTDVKRLEQISDAVDRLFAQVVRERVLATQETSDRIPVWGEPSSAQHADLLVRDQEEVAASLENGSSAYRRLKLAMDAWCALWFWPIEEAGLLPDRATWLAQMELILKGQVTHEQVWQQRSLFADLESSSRSNLVDSQSMAGDIEPQREASAERLKRLLSLSEAFCDRRVGYSEECGLTDIDVVLSEDASLRIAQRVVERIHFHHWTLRFAEVFATGGGFDLIVGNPPWVKLQWQESGVLSDYDPSIATRKISAYDAAKLRAAVLKQTLARGTYLEEYTELEGAQAFLNADQNYPLLKKVQPNLFKCFITVAWSNSGSDGVAAFLHPEGVYDDPKGGALRAALYPRLVAHYQFINEGHLFAEVHNLTKYSLNVYGKEQADVSFHHISNLFHPRTIDASWDHDGLGAVPGIKNSEDEFDASGHRHRLIHIRLDELGLFASLYDESGTRPVQARLPVVHSAEIIRVLRRIAEQPCRLGDLRERYFATVMFDEAYAQRDGTIRRETRYPNDISEWIVQGPHFYVGTPLNKTPNEGCNTNRDYSALDLTCITNDYLPRTNYLPACSASEYARRTPKWNGKLVTEYYRHLNRNMVSPTGERTLVSTIAPPGAAHVDPVFSIAFDDDKLLLDVSAMWSSLPLDFLVKTTGKAHVRQDVATNLPVTTLDPDVGGCLRFRVATLNCLTSFFAPLWERSVNSLFFADSFCQDDRRLRIPDTYSTGWNRACALRSDFERRQAILEIDVLASLALSLALDELLTIYRVQFPILQQYERDRVYDQHGRVVPTSKTALGNAAVSLVELAATLKEQAGFDVHAEYHPDGSNTQELRKQKIKLGKKEAGVLGVSERCTMADLLAETTVRWSDEDHPEGRPVKLVGLRYTDPGLEPRMERVYPTPWTRCDREADYRQAWAEFERRLGKKMPEGTPLEASS